MGTADLTQAQILVIDDEPANVRLLECMLGGAGYCQVRGTTDSRQVLALYAEFQPDLILLDLMMPHLDGIQVIRQLQIHEDVLLRIKNLLDTRNLYLDLERHNRSLEQIVNERTQRLLQSEKVATMRAFDLILSDTKMPILDGERFYAEIEQRFPRLRHRIVFVTGDILSREKREFLERTGAPHILKPFDLREVRQVVHRMLVAGGGARRESGPGS